MIDDLRCVLWTGGQGEHMNISLLMNALGEGGSSFCPFSLHPLSPPPRPPIMDTIRKAVGLPTSEETSIIGMQLLSSEKQNNLCLAHIYLKRRQTIAAALVSNRHLILFLSHLHALPISLLV